MAPTLVTSCTALPPEGALAWGGPAASVACMKQGLSLRVSQHLALTPQLQQSIRLLQLSTLELSQEVEQMLDDNPFLELTAGRGRARGVWPGAGRHAGARRTTAKPSLLLIQ